MDILAQLHMLLIFFPFIIVIGYLANLIPINKLKYLSPLLILYYSIQMSWSLNNNKCILTQMEKDDSNKHIYEKFPSAPFLPLHMNGFLEKMFAFFNIEYNNKNMERLIYAINILDFLIIWYFTSPLIYKNLN